MKHYAYNSPFEMVDKNGNKYTLRVEQDEMAESPREWDNMSTMICWHRHYNLGDKHNYEDSFEFLLGIAREIGIFTNDMWDMEQEELKKKIIEADSVLIVPLNLYDHSGISISTSNSYPYNDSWDAGCVGFIYVTKEKALEEWGGIPEKDENGDFIRISHEHPDGSVSYSTKYTPITEDNWKEVAEYNMDDEVKTYDQYLTNDVYGYTLSKKVIKQDKCPHCFEVIREYEDEEYVDSCWGFFGDCVL